MRIIALVIVAVLLVPCRKDKALFNGKTCEGNCYLLTGKVIDTLNKAPLSNVEVKFYYRPNGYAIFFNPTIYLGKANTNNEGQYRFTFDGTNYKQRKGYYWIEAKKTDYFYDPNNENKVRYFDLDSTKFGKNVIQDFALFEPATLRVRFKTTTLSNFSYLTFSYNYGNKGYGISLNGKRTIDTTISYKTAAGIRTFINWSALGNGSNIKKTDTVIVRKNVATNYLIEL